MARILPLVHHDENRRLLIQWIKEETDHKYVEPETNLLDTEFDLCIVDKSAFQRNSEELKEKKERTRVLLPYLFILSSRDSERLSIEVWDRVDDVIWGTIDETVTTPIRKFELGGRIRTLLRLREQSVQLHETKEKYRRLVEQNLAGIYIIQDREFKYVNPKLAEILGYEREELMSDVGPLDVVVEEDKDTVRENLRKREEGEVNTVQYTFQGKRKDGELIYLEAHGSRIEYDDKPAVMGVLVDITERVEKTRELELKNRAMDEASIGIVITDPSQPDNPIVYVNDEFTELTGYSEDEVLGRNCRFLQSDGTDPEPVNRMREAIDNRESVSVEVLNYRKDNTPFWNRVTITPIYDESDQLINFVGFQQDITEIKRTQERFQAFVENSMDIITVINQDGTVIYQSPAVERVLGYSPDKLIGEDVFDYIHPDDKTRVLETFNEILQVPEKVSERIEYRFRHKDGSWRWLESVGSNMEESIIGGYVINSRDITERKRRGRRLEVLNRVLRHDLRNNANVILGNAELLSNNVSEGPQKRRLELIMKKALDMVDMSDKSREIEESFTKGISRTPIDIVEKIENELDAVEAEHPGVDVEKELIEEEWVYANELIEYAIENVIENAIEHNDKPNPKLSVSMSNGDGYVNIDIADNGPGIPKGEIEVIRRGKETPLEHISGLGLWIVNWVVSEVGGEVDFSANEPEGSIVTIRLQKAELEGG